MSSERLLRYFHRAIARNDTQAFHDMLCNNPELKNHPECRSSLVEYLLSKTASANDEEMTDIIVNSFLTINDLEECLDRALCKGNVRLAEFFLKNGVELKTDSPIRYFLNITDSTDTREEVLTLLLKYGLDVSVKNERGQNLLHLFLSSVLEDDLDAVKIAEIILKSGISIDEEDGDGFSALHRAVTAQNVALVSFLLNKGADVNKQSKIHKISPLFAAARYRSVDVVGILISSGAKINATTSGGKTALHMACFYHREQIMSLLIRKGASICAETTRGKTPFSLLKAGEENYEQCVSVIIKELTKLVYGNFPVPQNDLALIKENSDFLKYFENCMAELSQIASTYYGPHSYYSMLNTTISMKKLAYLSKNETIVKNFEENLCRFRFFQNDLRRILDEATQIKNKLMIVESRLKSTFFDFFPDIVIRKLANSLAIEDIPLQLTILE